MAQSATEDMLSIQLTVGRIPITGFAAGGAIRFVKGQPDYTMRVGVGGLGSHTRVIDNSGTLSSDLLPTSDGNDIMNAFITFAKSRPNGAAFAVSLADTTGRMKCTAPIALVAQQPDMTIGDGSGVMSWDMIAVQWFRQVGGRGATPVFDYSDIPDIADIPGVRIPDSANI